MKKLFILLALAVPVMACAEKPITVEQLPAPARTFISEYFAEAKVSLVTVDKDVFNTDYEVVFADGSRVEFDKKGEWTDVDCGRNRLPEGIVPEAIVRYIANNHPSNFAREISRDRHDWEVSLSNGLDLKFDTAFRLIEIDD